MITLDTTQLIVTIIGSNALFTFVQFMITRHDKKKEKQSDETKGMRRDRKHLAPCDIRTQDTLNFTLLLSLSF